MKVFDTQTQMSDPFFTKESYYIWTTKTNPNRKEPAQAEGAVIDTEVSVWTVVSLAPTLWQPS